MDPATWAILAITVILAAYTLTLKPAVPPPPQAGQLDIPTTEEGTPVAVIFGDMLLKQTQVIDTAEPFKKAIKTKTGKKG